MLRIANGGGIQIDGERDPSSRGDEKDFVSWNDMPNRHGGEGR
jgi:hypothetical protein